MKFDCVLLVFILIVNGSVGSTEFDDAFPSNTTSIPDTTTSKILAEGEKLMSSYIMEMIEHFKQKNPVGLPGAEVPDPYPVPDMTKSLPLGTLYFQDTAVYGISQFKITFVNADIENMVVQAGMEIEKLDTFGNYTYCTLMCFSKTKGPFTVNVTGLTILGNASLAIERDGRLRAQDIDMDIKFETILLNFKNLGLLGSVIQNLMNSLSYFLFDSIKPYILRDSSKKMRIAVNEKLCEFTEDVQFPNTISPLDMVIVDARNAIKQLNMDPYKLPDQEFSKGIFVGRLRHTWITGLSSIYRIGNISLAMKNATVIADIDVGTQKLEGSTYWEFSALGGTIINMTGMVSFSVQYINAKIVLAQPLDTRQTPDLKTLDFDVGNIQVRSDGAGSLDYVIEFVVNIAPNLLRQEIIKLSQNSLKLVLQNELNTLNVEYLIKENLPYLDAMQENGFKLSVLRATGLNPYPPYNGDNFFNF